MEVAEVNKLKNFHPGEVLLEEARNRLGNRLESDVSVHVA